MEEKPRLENPRVNNNFACFLPVQKDILRRMVRPGSKEIWLLLLAVIRSAVGPQARPVQGPIPIYRMGALDRTGKPLRVSSSEIISSLDCSSCAESQPEQQVSVIQGQ